MIKPILVFVACALALPLHAQAPEETPPTPEAQVASSNALSTPEQIIDQFRSGTPPAREYTLGKISEAYAEDPGNPALRLERMLVSDKGTILQITGLPRKDKKFSAIIDVESLYLQALKSGKQYKAVLHLGGTQVAGKNEKTLVQILPQENLYLFFETIDDYQAHSLRYTNWNGRPDSYFDTIDPRFRERYDNSYKAATEEQASVEAMKGFLLEFARNDPDARAQKVFVTLIRKLRSQNTFDGYYQAYQLVKDPADEKAAARLARTDEQQSKLQAAILVTRQAEAAKQEEIRRAQEAQAAEQRKREEARLAEQRKQDEIRLAEQKAAQAKAEEEKCMRTPACRQAWLAQQAKCEQEIMHCRQQCDTVTGANRSSGFLAGLSSAMLARTCYTACKCGSSFGSLLGKFNSMAADARSSSQSTADNKKSSVAGQMAAQSNKVFECKIFCVSADGPEIYRKINAESRREAANTAEKNADRYCAEEGKSYASKLQFRESQCRER